MIAWYLATLAAAAPPEVLAEISLRTRQVGSEPPSSEDGGDRYTALAPPLGLTLSQAVHVSADGQGAVLIEVGVLTDPSTADRVTVREWNAHASVVLLSIRDAYAPDAEDSRPYAGFGLGATLVGFAIPALPDLWMPAPRLTALCGVAVRGPWPGMNLEARLVVNARTDQYTLDTLSAAGAHRLLLRPGGVALTLGAGLGFR